MNTNLNFFANFPSLNSLNCHPYTKAQVESLIETGKLFEQEGIPALTHCDFMLYWQTGNREHYQAKYYKRRGHLLVFSLLVKIFPSEARYLELLSEAIWAICSENYWCLPAHFIVADGIPLPENKYEQCLDLFACETAFALSEVCAMHKNILPPLIITLISTNVQKRIFDVFENPNIIQRFESMENNWSAVCASAIGGAAVHMLNNCQQKQAIINRCVKTINVYLSSFGEDGICAEGVDYWSYGFGFFVCFADLLAKDTNCEINLLSNAKAHAIARSQIAFYLNNNCTLSFSDGSSNSSFRTGISCYLASCVKNVVIPSIACAAPLLADTCYRYCLALRDLMWFNGSLNFGENSKSAWYEDAQWFISKNLNSSLAAKAGHNGESHNHNDCGSFIFCKNSKQILCDLGAGLYDADYFSDKRYTIFVNRSKNHNLPLIAGCEQSCGKEFAAKKIHHEFNTTHSEFIVDITNCYPKNIAKNITRTIKHFDSGKLIITDNVSFDECSTITEQFVSLLPIVKNGDSVQIGDKTNNVVLNIPEGWSANIASETYMNHNNKNETANILQLTNITPQKDICVSFNFS